MSFRKMLLRIMLWSLGFAAAAGVLAVLLEGGALVWRVVGTGITTAVACVLMMSTSAMVDREKSRSAGLFGMSVVIIEYTVALMLIWHVLRNVLGLRIENELGETMILFGMLSIVAMLFLRLKEESGHVVAGKVGLVTTFVMFTACLFAIWRPYNSAYSENWWHTAGVIGLAGGLAVVALIGLGSSRRLWRWAGVGAAVVVCAMWLSDIWVGVGSDPGFVVFCVLLTIAVVVAHANLVLLCPVTKEQRWVLSGTIAVAIVTAALVDLLAIDDKLPLFGVGDVRDILGRFAAAGGIVTGCGSLGLCVLARLNRKVDYEQLTPELSEMTVVCPRCSKKQAVCFGGSSCASCGLRITIRIEEPRCPQCDYLLYLLTSDRCPECGLEIGVQAQS